jgi:hypothetical protein
MTSRCSNSVSADQTAPPALSPSCPGTGRAPVASSSRSSEMRRARPRPVPEPVEGPGRSASVSYQESKICRKIHCVQRTYSGSIVAKVRRESWPSPRRRS